MFSNLRKFSFSSKKHTIATELFKNSKGLLGFSVEEISNMPNNVSGLTGKLAY
jgi:hypothetical protein